MADSASGPADPLEVSDAQASHLLGNLKVLRDQWRARLADPAFLELVRLGKVQINPLVRKLLNLPLEGSPPPPSGQVPPPLPSGGEQPPGRPRSD